MSTQKVVIITAASQGIGAGCARELASQGYRVSFFSGTLRAAMEGFTKLYAKRYRQDHIRMNSVAPYFVADDLAELEGWDVPSDLMWGRPATYSELAKTVAFLLSDEAKFITGTTLKVDEAWSATV
ncbi:MAG: SDR family oxidoreductase [Cyanobacteria bacterium P01_F01_bin.86]